MSDILTISLSWIDILFVVLMLASSGLFVYFSIMSYIHKYKVNLLYRVTNDIEGFAKSKVVTSPVAPLTAEQAKKLKKDSATQEQVNALLKPVFAKISKAFEKGDSEIFLSGSDWYYSNNEKYKLATQQLTGLGYSVWKENNFFGVRVKW